MNNFEKFNPEQPLKEILSDRQIKFVDQNLEETDIDSILEKSLKDLMTSDDSPAVSELFNSTMNDSNDQPI